ncbi:phosphatidic acid phosphatase type 2/haloperoxidase [Lineolata rhizophorae]|uniref:Phosphatidic acid phosphatase type 2/haloperoxidase n=1 Tax=Lineolata rhizophorae TaxID=578093 RepID=A0A6A6NQ11_9PEZI|nr:phosphatidic acid phosphatase type 2/haloperoxidase [Lineolata rhizophorae]
MAGPSSARGARARASSAAAGNGFVASAQRFWQRSYASDYVGLALLVVAYLLIVLFVEPFHRMFSLDNIAIQYPHAEVERVPVPWLFVYAGLIPLGVLVAWAVIFRGGAHKMHVTVLGFITSLILTSFITDVIKNAVGRPRPDLIARCKPEPGTPAHKLVTYEICTETNHHTLHDGWRSFPSGHSSFAFAGLGFLSLFVAGQLHVFRPRTNLTHALLALAPLLAAALIAISRCEDYRHDVYDVTTGSLLGILVALFTYRRYYPPLRARRCDEPYPNPGEMMRKAEGGGWTKVKDEETGEFELDEMDEEREGLTATPGRSGS